MRPNHIMVVIPLVLHIMLSQNHLAINRPRSSLGSPAQNVNYQSKLLNRADNKMLA